MQCTVVHVVFPQSSKPAAIKMFHSNSFHIVLYLGYFYWRSVAEELGFQYESRGWESNPIESLLKAYGEKEGSTIRGLIEATRGAGLTLSARQLERKFDTTFSSE